MSELNNIIYSDGQKFNAPHQYENIRFGWRESIKEFAPSDSIGGAEFNTKNRFKIAQILLAVQSNRLFTRGQKYKHTSARKRF